METLKIFKKFIFIKIFINPYICEDCFYNYLINSCIFEFCLKLEICNSNIAIEFCINYIIYVIYVIAKGN